MARVLKNVRPGVMKEVRVKNLGWFFRKARHTVIDRFDMMQSNYAWEMFADFADGDKFQTTFASIVVFKEVMNRQRSLRGVPVTVTYLDGGQEHIVLGKNR